MPVVGTASKLPQLSLGGLPGNNKITEHFQVNASTQSGGYQVYTGNIKYIKTLFWVAPITTTLTDRTRNSPSGGYLPFDNFPGGYYSNNTGITSSADEDWKTANHIDITGPVNFCAIPVASAFDLGSTPSALIQADYLRPYGAATPPTSPKNTPFANFITARDNNNNAYNEQHITFTTRNGDWLANELAGTPITSDCHYICSNNAIVGPPLVCNNSTNTFSVPSFNGITYSWTTSGNLSIVGLQNMPTVQVHSNGTNGAETLTCVYGNTTCGNVTITRQVINGGLAPDYSVGMIAGTHYLGGQTVHITASTPTPGPLTWNWVVAGASITGGQGTSTVTILTDQPPYSANNTPLYLDLGVNTINSCGDPSPYYQLHAFVDADGLPEPLKIQAYPVPANQDITIASSKDGTAKEPFTYLVYDKLGKIVRTGKSNGEDISVKLADLSSDIYILHITVKGKTTQKQIIVQH